MDTVQRIFMEIFSASSTYFLAAALILFLHCFYDRGFQWNKKKAIILLTVVLTTSLIGFLINGSAYESLKETFQLAEESLLSDDYLFGEDPFTKWSEENFLVLFFSQVLEIAIIAVAVYDFKGNKVRGIALFYLAYLLAQGCIMYTGIVFANYILPQDRSTVFFSGDFIGTGTISSTIIATVFCGIVFFYLYFCLYRQNVVVLCGKRENILILVYCVVCSAINIVMLTYEMIANLNLVLPPRENDLPMVVMVSAYAILMLMIPVFVYYTRIQTYYRERTQYQEKFMEAELEHFMQFKQAQEETQRFRHDIRNDLLCMNEMLQNGKTEDAAKYLQDLLGVSQRLSAKYVTGDEMLDCIVSAKAGSMEQKGIRFKLDGVLAGGLGWKPMDICSVFANAIDNAMEACMQLPEADREIEMKIKGTSQFWFLRIENPVKAPVNVDLLFQEKGGYTTKQNAGQHGIGTYNMKHTVEANGGMLKAECKDLRFILEIMIDKNNA